MDSHAATHQKASEELQLVVLEFGFGFVHMHRRQTRRGSSTQTQQADHMAAVEQHNRNVDYAVMTKMSQLRVGGQDEPPATFWLGQSPAPTHL